MNAKSLSPNNQKPAKRQFSGLVVSNQSNKTIVVKVNRTKIHPRYQKRYTVSEKYHVHDEKNQFHVGDQVTFQECRPLSLKKKWRVVYHQV
ncbi:MAG TPA: 30S ribosomal protein S17 [bacterium]|nr:30S ribosomal protein S17 [bacterium]HPL95887.1 30S ribosomal protein S17 [bacterium]